MAQIIFVVAGVIAFVLGLAALVFPKRAADANDLWGPRWFREFSLSGRTPAYEGRTTRVHTFIVGFILVAAGLALFAAAASL